jgi:NAD(P)-dependent dehydrogenase (short-subunit alcohol dehydrogenase family)
MSAGSICFSEEDLQLFCEASGDRNPLHLEAGYASKTAYGQRVVFGALGAVACLGRLGLSANHRISRITADFHRPMFLGVDYRIESSPSAKPQTVRLFDGSVPVLTLTVVGEETISSSSPDIAHLPVFERSQARELAWQDIQIGQEFSGCYAADFFTLRELCQRWGITSSFAVEALLWSSYFVGMEMPGRDALFFRVALDLTQDLMPCSPFDYLGVVSGLNKAIEQVKVRVTLNRNGSQIAYGHVLAFIRPQLNSFNFQAPLQQDSISELLKGKVAVVLGASRGLGAALVSSLALEGAQVVAVSRSRVELGSKLPASMKERIVWETSDCADSEAVMVLYQRVVEDFGRLDFLICNAFPPIPALRLEANALGRIQAYISQSINLVLTPLCTFLPLLNESNGCAVIISSSAVEKPVREWPHYTAAKSAIESLGTVAPLQYPNVSSLIVRPTRLLTDMTNTPMGRQKAIAPMTFASQITKKLLTPPSPGTTEVLRSHAGEPSNEL